MSCTCVVGLQWGDEAKGKIVDLLGNDHDLVVRYNGGANAGHTIVWGDRTFKLSLLPTGILKPHLRSVIGNGLVVYPPRLLEEIKNLREAGITVGTNLAVSDHCHVIFPYHMEEERVIEQEGGGAIGTTGRGIGPCYQDKVGRTGGIRMGELLHPERLRERLRTIVPRKNRIIAALANGANNPKQFNPDELCDEYLKYAEALKPHVTDTAKLLHESIKAGKKIVFEAAQGSLLDIDHGTYPYVTSSNSLPGGIWNGSGVPTRNVTKIIGVVKAYTTRVGKGPFPTELDDGPTGIGERIRKIGREYGTVTGRPRRVGWFDAVAVRYTSALAGVDEVTVMLLDVLSGLKELKICTGYTMDGKPIDGFPSDAYLLERCTPVYETLPGWEMDLTKARKKSDLPKEAMRYVERISELIGLRVMLTSVGPDREQSIIL
ncbi:MAG: adenylosuccinate synthase [Planctomycetes bacterium]|nr:adenylosuccinate synthase [Planctomycetota bacterium]